MRYVSFYPGRNMMQWDLHSTSNALCLSPVGHNKCGMRKYPVHPTFQPLRVILDLHSGTDTTILSKLHSSRGSSVLTRLRVRPLMNQCSIPDRGTYLFFPTSRTALRPIKPVINGYLGIIPGGQRSQGVKVV